MISIPLLPEQLTFLNSLDPIVAYIGGIGAGKTFISSVTATKKALQKRTQLMLALTYAAGRDVILPTLRKVFGLMGLKKKKSKKKKGDYTINKSDLEVTFRNGYKILIRSAEQGDRLRGLNISDAYIDEAAYHKDRSLFDILIGRLRESEFGQIYLTTSPAGFNWVYDLTLQKSCKTINVSTFKNSFLSKQYIKTLLAQYSSKFALQELWGQFVEMGGTIFKSGWIRNIKDYLLLQKERLKNKARKIRFWDFGFGSDEKADYSAGVLLEELGDGRYLIDDIVRVKHEYTDLKKIIKETAKKDGRDIPIGFEIAGQQKAIVDDLMAMPELTLYIKKKLNVSKYGAKIKRILPVASLAENGKLYISPGCRNKKEFMNEVDSLTMDDTHLHDDMADATASALIVLSKEWGSVKGRRGNIYG